MFIALPCFAQDDLQADDSKPTPNVMLNLIQHRIGERQRDLAINDQQLLDDSKPIEVGISFDWISKSQMQRDENIKQIQDTLFNNVATSFPKKVFKKQYASFLRDENHWQNFEDIYKNNKTEDDKANYCAFRYGNTSLLVMYGIQYKNDLKHIYYYDAFGKLYFVDIFSANYPNFPYDSYQYDMSGKLAAAYHYNSAYDQYAYDANKKFRGRWYRENYYNRRAKVVMTRSSW